MKIALKMKIIGRKFGEMQIIVYFCQLITIVNNRTI